jgi:hypothetical protein
MIDSFLSIPDAESLPLYRMVLKLACVLWAQGYASHSAVQTVSIPVHMPVPDQLH